MQLNLKKVYPLQKIWERPCGPFTLIFKLCPSMWENEKKKIDLMSSRVLSSKNH